MSNIFNLDAPIWVFMGEVADVIILALLWWVCSLGIITMGASTTALFYVMGKKIRKEQTYVAKDFFKSFKQNFRQSVPMTILLIVAFISLGLYLSFIFQANRPDADTSSLTFILPITIIFAFEVLNVNTYLWALLSRFDVPTRALIRTTFILIHKHLLTTLCNLGVIGVVCVAIVKYPLVIIVAPAVIIWGQSFMLQSVFTKYIEAAQTAEENDAEQAEEVEDTESYIEMEQTVEVSHIEE